MQTLLVPAFKDAVHVFPFEAAGVGDGAVKGHLDEFIVKAHLQPLADVPALGGGERSARDAEKLGRLRELFAPVLAVGDVFLRLFKGQDLAVCPDIALLFDLAHGGGIAGGSGFDAVVEQHHDDLRRQGQIVIQAEEPFEIVGVENMSHGALRLDDEGGKARVLPAAINELLGSILRQLVRRRQFQ